MKHGWLLALIVPWLMAAGVYRSVSPDGTVIYSDQPIEGADLITVNPVQSVPPLKPTNELSTTPVEPEAEAPVYQYIELISPENDAVIASNSGMVTISVKASPHLMSKRGHRFVVVLNGKRLDGRFTGSTMSLNDVDRGTHTVAVEIVDQANRVLIRTTAHTFHLRRHSVLFTP
ncbi:MAG: DUF4124 domain-containing protein [Gammaproteobacteria bacterium]|nr:DUF4124 domain-containing protein [Gammaproteobacteria bacterium]